MQDSVLFRVPYKQDLLKIDVGIVINNKDFINNNEKKRR